MAKMTKTSELAFKALKPLLRHTEKNRGTVAVIVEKLKKRTGLEFHRQHVELWVHHDLKKRVEPRLGAGLLLLEIQKELCGTED